MTLHNRRPEMPDHREDPAPGIGIVREPTAAELLADGHVDACAHLHNAQAAEQGHTDKAYCWNDAPCTMYPTTRHDCAVCYGELEGATK